MLRTISQHSRLKIASIVTLGGAIWIGLYIFPYYGFRWIGELLPGSAISDRVISLFFLLLTVMLIFSNAVIAYTALFRSKEAWFLHSCPYPNGTVLLYKLAESLTFSSWAFLLLGVPIMLAYGVHRLAPWYYYLAMFVYFFSFVLIPASIGALIALAISTVLRPWMRKVLTRAAVALVVVALILGSTFGHKKRRRTGILQAPALLQSVSFSHSIYWPSAWISRGLAVCAGTPGSENLGDAAYYLGLLLSNSLFLCLLAYTLAARTYGRAWDRIHSMSSRVRRSRSGRPARLARSFRLSGEPFRLAGGGARWPVINLVVKDLRTFVRDPVQWAQCAVLFGLLGIYILNLRNLRYPTEKAFWRNLTSFLNLGSICLVLATLTTRFVFPMFSLEGRRFWVLGLVPIRRSRILWSKFLFAFVASLAITELLMVMSDLILGEGAAQMLLHVFTVAMISLGLSGLSVGLSALYPNLAETSPAKIVSGFGGTLNLILSLLYVSVVVAVIAAPMQMYVRGRLTEAQMLSGMSYAVAILIALTAVAFALPMWLGSKALARMEF